MQKIIRKTSTMYMMEYKFGKEIDTLILDALIQSRGEQKQASDALGISPSTMSRWINELNLTRQVSRIRKQNGLPPTTGELRMEVEGKEIIELSVVDNCSDCNARFEDFKSHKITHINTEDGKHTAVVRDELNRKHWFSLNIPEMAY